MDLEQIVMPPVDQGQMLGYEAIRYIAGYPESYVKSYAAAIGVDTDGRYFFEVAWMCWAVGVA